MTIGLNCPIWLIGTEKYYIEMLNEGGVKRGMSYAFIIWLLFVGLGIYCTALLIKLSHRGIKALDIYISKNGNDQY